MAFLGGWKYKLSKQRIKSNTHAEEIFYFIFQKEAIFAGADTLKGKCMTKLMKVCIRNNQFIDSRKCTSTETLDKSKKTLADTCVSMLAFNQ